MLRAQNLLTYVLENGDERTVPLNGENLNDIVKWFHDESSRNVYELSDGDTVLYKDTIISVKY